MKGIVPQLFPIGGVIEACRARRGCPDCDFRYVRRTYRGVMLIDGPVRAERLFALVAGACIRPFVRFVPPSFAWLFMIGACKSIQFLSHASRPKTMIQSALRDPTRHLWCGRAADLGNTGMAGIVVIITQCALTWGRYLLWYQLSTPAS